MKLRPLIIDDAIRTGVAKVIMFAKENPYTMADLYEIRDGKAPPPGGLPQFTLAIPMGFKVVYTEELQKPGTIAHISISVSGEGSAMPSPTAVDEILTLFGMQTLGEGADVQQISIETNDDGSKAINV